MKELDKLQIPYKKASNTSIIASFKGENKGKTIALRGDIDALPILMRKQMWILNQKPRDLCMPVVMMPHAAMLLGAAILSEIKDQIPGEVRFFFQEAEETFSGAKKIIEAGGMEGVDVLLWYAWYAGFKDRLCKYRSRIQNGRL